MKFCHNFEFLTFVVFVAKTSNKLFCELDKLLRNFCSWQMFVFVRVYEIFSFEVCNFKQWSCNVSERYCSYEQAGTGPSRRDI